MQITLPPDIVVPCPDAFLVGGSVRDLLRGREPLDYDIAVLRAPESYAARLARQLGSRVIRMGRAPFTVHRVVSGDIQVDVAAINGSGIEQDLGARDFTVNALACDIPGGRIIDTTGGMRDLKLRQVRMVSPGAFAADPIRLLRAFRMAAVLDFDIDPGTLAAVGDSAARIQHSAGERVLNELQKTLACDQSHRQVARMAGTGLLQAIFPEFIPMANCGRNRHHAANALPHTLTAYRVLEDLLNRPRASMLGASGQRFTAALDTPSRTLLKLAILLHDIGKPACRSVDGNGAVHFYGHAAKGAEQLQSICRRLRMSNHDRDWLVFMVKHHQRPLDLYLASDPETGRIPPKAAGRFFRQCGPHAPSLLVHALADNLAKNESGDGQPGAMQAFLKQLLTTCLDRVRTRQANPLINGNDLIQHFGLDPSPQLGSILQQVEEAYLAGMIENRRQALEWISDRLRKPDP